MTRLVAIPDTDGDLGLILRRLEEVLVQLQPYDPDDEAPPLGLGVIALEAVESILSALVAAERAPAVQLMASSGTLELVRVRFVALDEADLAGAGEAVAALGLALLPGGDEMAAGVLRTAVDHGERSTGLVAAFARAHGMIDLAADDDTCLLADLVRGRTGRVVLTLEEERAHKRLTDRALAMFRPHEPTATSL